jgi:catechol 2,3-dioxygenase-like lactoylglutathione lyase family enzyme
MKKNSWYKLDHLGILVKDVKKAREFYKKMFDFDLPETGPYSKAYDTGGYWNGKYCLISGKGKGDEEIFIEFLEIPPNVDTSSLGFTFSNPEGAIVELCIAVDDLDEWYNKVKRMGYTVVSGWSKKPLTEEQKYVRAPSGSKYFYLLPEETGTQFFIEILERPNDPYRKQ